MTRPPGIDLAEDGSGWTRYGRALALYAAGELNTAQLEACRLAAAADRDAPPLVIGALELPLPPDPEATPEVVLGQAVAAVDRYLSTLAGPGLSEARAALAPLCQGGGGAVRPQGHPVVEAWLEPALQALARSHPALALRLLDAAPHLAWTPTTIRGARGASLARNPGCTVDLWLAAPHALCPDHHHAAPELCVPLSGLQVWRFGPESPLVIRRAHVPVWIEAFRPHLIKAGALPLLCLCIRTSEIESLSHALPASDWPSLKELRL